MSTEVTLTTMCGLLVPYDLEADTSASTVGQAGPLAGVPLPAEDSAGRGTALTLVASGEQTATTTLAVTTQDAGNVDDATYRVLPTVSGVARATASGADVPNVLTGFSGIGWAGSTRQTHPHAVTPPDDAQVVVYADRATALDPWDIKTRVWSPSMETYASAVTVVSSLDASHAPWPFLLLMPDPHNQYGDPVLLLGHWDADDTNNVANINLYISRDGGATWSAYKKGALEADIAINSGSPYYTLGRVRAAMVGSQIVLYIHLTSSASPTENVQQWASASAGARFEYVGLVGSSALPTGYPDVVSVGSVAYLVYSYDDDIYIAMVRNAFVRVLSGTVIGAGDVTVSASTAAGSITWADFACTLSDSGKIVIASVQSTSNQRNGLTHQYDTATATASTIGGPYRYWFDDGKATSTDFPTQIAASWYRGQLRVYANMDSGTTTYEHKLTRLDIGGLTTVTMPGISKSGSDALRAGWIQTYIPTALPSGYTGWTRTTTGGSDDITTTPGRHNIATAASTRWYSYSPAIAATATSQQVMSLTRVWQVSGGSVGAREIVVGLRFAIAGVGYHVEARCSATQIRSYDVHAGATLSTVSADVAGGVDILFALSGTGKVSMWYREVGTDEDRNFIEIETQTSCTDDAAAGGAVCVYSYGSISASTATAEYIPLGQNLITTYGINDLATAFSNPTTLRGIPYGTNTYALAGVKLTATGGPALAGDAYALTPDATYPYRNVLPARDPESTIEIQGGQRPSSREAASCWRSTALSGYLVFRHRGSRNRFVPAAFGVHVEGLNVPTYPVYGYNEDSAAWVLIGTGTQYKTVRFVRTNANSPVLKVDTSNTSTDEPFLYKNELAGGYVKFVTSGDVRPIRRHGQGRWSADGDAATLQLELDPDSIDGTEDTTGSIELWYPRSTFYAYLLPTVKYSKYAIYWSGAQTPYEGYIKANVIAMGQILPLVRTRDWGTIVTWTNPSTITEMESGLRFGVQKQIASRKIVTVPMIGLQEQAALLDSTTSGLDRRYFKLSATSSMPVAGQFGDTPGLLAGAWQQMMGSRDPGVYIPRIGAGTPDTGTLLGQEQVGHYSRITSEPRFTDRYGIETGEVYGAVYVGENVVFEGEL